MEDYMIQILILMETESLMHTSIQLWMIWFETELEDDLLLAGLNETELECMDADERREALEDAGLDPDDYDFD